MANQPFESRVVALSIDFLMSGLVASSFLPFLSFLAAFFPAIAFLLPSPSGLPLVDFGSL